MRILIVDDERAIQEGVKRTVQTAFPNWQIQTAETGEQALLILAKDKLDIVVMDVMMPGIGGLELLRQGATDKSVRWVVISAYSDFNFAQEALRHGARDYMLKPIGKAKLIDLLLVLEAEIREEQATRQNQQKLQEQLNYAREAVFKAWAAGLDTTGKYFDVHSFAEKYECCSVILLQAMQLQEESKHSEIKQRLTALLNENGHGFAVDLDKQVILAVFSSYQLTNNQPLDESFKAYLIERIKHYGDYHVQISESLQCFTELPGIVERLLDNKMTSGEKSITHSSNELVESAIHFIKEHYQHNLSLEKVAAAVYLNPVYFSQLFKKVTGTGYKDFVIQFRVDQAKKLLVQSDLKVTDIAEQVGYSDLRHFTQVFRKMVSMTPSEYRALKLSGPIVPISNDP